MFYHPPITPKPSAESFDPTRQRNGGGGGGILVSVCPSVCSRAGGGGAHYMKITTYAPPFWPPFFQVYGKYVEFTLSIAKNWQNEQFRHPPSPLFGPLYHFESTGGTEHLYPKPNRVRIFFKIFDFDFLLISLWIQYELVIIRVQVIMWQRGYIRTQFFLVFFLSFFAPFIANYTGAW